MMDRERLTGNKILYDGLQVFAPPGVHVAAIAAICKNCGKKQRVLEIGSGAGALTRRMLQLGFQVTASGIDPETFQLQEVDFRYLDMQHPLMSEMTARYDIVVATEVIEHLEDVFMFFRNVAQLLAPDGILVLTTPNVLAVYSRILFLRSGRVLLCNEGLMKSWGHIQVLPEWLLCTAAQDVGLYCIERRGVGSLRYDKLPKWHKWLQNVLVPLAKIFLKERFAGEFQGSNLLMVFKKTEI
jgi:SAM-dependent methyltransferase